MGSLPLIGNILQRRNGGSFENRCSNWRSIVDLVFQLEGCLDLKHDAYGTTTLPLWSIACIWLVPNSQRHRDVGTTSCFLARERPSSPYAQSPKRLQSRIILFEPYSYLMAATLAIESAKADDMCCTNWNYMVSAMQQHWQQVCSDAPINCLPSWGYSGHIPRKSWFTKMRTRQVIIERCSGGKGFCDRKHAVWVLRSLSFYAWFIKNFSHCSVCAEATVTFLLGHSAQNLLVDRFAAVFNWDVLLFLVHALLMFEPWLRNHPSNRGPLYSICAMFSISVSFWQYCSTACWLAQANSESKLPRRSKFQAPGEVAK